MYKAVFFALASTLLFSGCVTYQSPSVRTQQTEDQLIQQENQRRIAGRIETLEMEINRISSELDALRRNIDSQYATLERKTEEDKREMIARLSSQMEKLIKQAAPAAPSYSGSAAGATGYEHVVQRGETLSAIAKAYNVTTKAIIEANRIKNPNRLSVGQKLFIPE